MGTPPPVRLVQGTITVFYAGIFILLLSYPLTYQVLLSIEKKKIIRAEDKSKMNL
jgi:hypothetical protein